MLINITVGLMASQKHQKRSTGIERMSCCGGSCGCGSDCKCGDGCKGCKMFPDFASGGEGRAEIRIAGVAPQYKNPELVETNGGVENEGCKCGTNCPCNPCNCK